MFSMLVFVCRDPGDTFWHEFHSKSNKVLSHFKNSTSNSKKHLESQHSTIKFTEQVPPGGVKQRAASKTTASTSAGGPPAPTQQKLDFGV